MTGQAVGLALSGGGSRAAAFGLGCLRGLHDRGVLPKVSVVSGISGGSLLAALWAYGPPAFDDFDQMTCDLLREGLHKQIARAAAGPALLVRGPAGAARSLLPAPLRGQRTLNRTDALRRVLVDAAFGDKAMPDVTRPGLATVVTATDLITTNAVRFGSLGSSCSALGRIADRITVAEAVAASAAYPVLLPAVERTYAFEQRDGSTRTLPVALTDGGVYDNLGLTVLEPGRHPAYTGHVYDVDYVIACDAGRGALTRSMPRLWPRRMTRVFSTTYRKTQDAGRARLHEAAASGALRGFVQPYLGMPDSRMPVPVTDLVPRDRVASYGTDFAAMSQDDLEALAGRGEQLTRALLGHYCPGL
jgi:NTE family protein